MTLPLYQPDANGPSRRDTDGHAGLWYDKFCGEWRVRHSTWSLQDRKGEWIKTLTDGKVGCRAQIEEMALRLAAMVDAHSGQWSVFTSESRFVTGLGRSHPVENGFAWHPTLGTPYLPGSSMKGLVRAWAINDAVPTPGCDTITRLLGDAGTSGSIGFLDAVPTAPVRLEADVMTPHYAEWTASRPPGDWRSPVPIPFLVTAGETPFLFGLVPRRTVSSKDLAIVSGWLSSALTWAGAGAKTAVGYGRFRQDTDKENDLSQRLCDRERARAERISAAQEAVERARRLAAMSPVEREIHEALYNRENTSESEVVFIIQEIQNGRWVDAKIEVANWLQDKMQREKLWKEQSGSKNPKRDKNYQRTILVKSWLSGK